MRPRCVGVRAMRRPASQAELVPAALRITAKSRLRQLREFRRVVAADEEFDRAPGAVLLHHVHGNRLAVFEARDELAVILDEQRGFAGRRDARLETLGRTLVETHRDAARGPAAEA